MRTDVVVIGAGHSGLSMSRRLAERSVEHVVLERGEVADSWRTARWDSLRLLTPNWQTRFPDRAYDGDEPDGFMTSGELADLIARYARESSAPVVTGTTVARVSAADGGYDVVTDRGTWHAASVVIATGISGRPDLPEAAAALPAGVASLAALDYRSPEQVADAGVLVVGASSTGAQLADELARSGRRVVLSVGEHVRMPRTYRGRDIFWWLDAAGVLDEGYEDVDDVVRARNVPSPQLVGSPDGRSVDLNALQARGVEIVGRLGMLRDGVALFSGGLANVLRLADLKLDRLLGRFDEWADGAGVTVPAGPERPEPATGGAGARLQFDLRREGIGTVLWATGYRADLSWLDLPVLDRRGELRHDGGVVTGAPGVYSLGTSLLRRRRSTYLSGAEQDTLDLAEHLVADLGGRGRDRDADPDRARHRDRPQSVNALTQ